MNQTPFEQELDVALKGIGYSLGSPEYRQEILLASQVAEAANPLLGIFKEIASEGNMVAKLLFSEDFSAVRKRTGKFGNVVLEYELLILSEGEKIDNINSASEAELEEMIRNAISKGPLNEKFRAYVPSTLKIREGMSRRQKMAAKFLASSEGNKEGNIISVSAYPFCEGGLADVEIGNSKSEEHPYNPRELAAQVARSLSAYQKSREK